MTTGVCRPVRPAIEGDVMSGTAIELLMEQFASILCEKIERLDSKEIQQAVGAAMNSRAAQQIEQERKRTTSVENDMMQLVNRWQAQVDTLQATLEDTLTKLHIAQNELLALKKQQPAKSWWQRILGR